MFRTSTSRVGRVDALGSTNFALPNYELLQMRWVVLTLLVALEVHLGVGTQYNVDHNFYAQRTTCLQPFLLPTVTQTVSLTSTSSVTSTIRTYTIITPSPVFLYETSTVSVPTTVATITPSTTLTSTVTDTTTTSPLTQTVMITTTNTLFITSSFTESTTISVTSTTSIITTRTVAVTCP
uniref:Uncharacterized protein n=1 Tax=Anopheles farauti TaxID=69004 RepID=A0A182QMS5_9DIPT